MYIDQYRIAQQKKWEHGPWVLVHLIGEIVHSYFAQVVTNRANRPKTAGHHSDTHGDCCPVQDHQNTYQTVQWPTGRQYLTEARVDLKSLDRDDAHETFFWPDPPCPNKKQPLRVVVVVCLGFFLERERKRQAEQQIEEETDHNKKAGQRFVEARKKTRQNKNKNKNKAGGRKDLGPKRKR